MVDLTKRQQEIFDFIKKYSAKYGYPPTVRDIGKAVGLASSSTVHAHLANLERAGLLRRDPTKPRALELLGRERREAEVSAPTGDAVRLPLVGEIVVALVGEEATVKRFFKEADHIRLQPEHDTMEPIYAAHVQVIGRVVGVFREL